jgi:hypothetical protein
MKGSDMKRIAMGVMAVAFSLSLVPLVHSQGMGGMDMKGMDQRI